MVITTKTLFCTKIYCVKKRPNKTENKRKHKNEPLLGLCPQWEQQTASLIPPAPANENKR